MSDTGKAFGSISGTKFYKILAKSYCGNWMNYSSSGRFSRNNYGKNCSNFRKKIQQKSVKFEVHESLIITDILAPSQTNKQKHK